MRGTERIEALSGQAQASRVDRLTQSAEIAAGGGNAGTDARRWRGTDFDLPAGLCGKQTATRERAMRAQPGEGGGHSLLIHRQPGVAVIADQPFQFDPDLAGRAGLETDPVYVLFGAALGERLGIWPVWQAAHGIPITGRSGHMRWFSRRISVTVCNHSTGTCPGTW